MFFVILMLEKEGEAWDLTGVSGNKPGQGERLVFLGRNPRDSTRGRRVSRAGADVGNAVGDMKEFAGLGDASTSAEILGTLARILQPLPRLFRYPT